MRNSRRSIILAVSSGIALAACSAEIDDTSHRTSQALSAVPDQVLEWNVTALRIFAAKSKSVVRVPVAHNSPRLDL